MDLYYDKKGLGVVLTMYIILMKKKKTFFIELKNKTIFIY